MKFADSYDFERTCEERSSINTRVRLILKHYELAFNSYYASHSLAQQKLRGIMQGIGGSRWEEEFYATI